MQPTITRCPLCPSCQQFFLLMRPGGRWTLFRTYSRWTKIFCHCFIGTIQMFSDSVLMWGSLVLVVLLAFYLLPTYERMEVSSRKSTTPTAPSTTPSTAPSTAPKTTTPTPPEKGDEYVLKSSLVPCTCPTYSASCPSHAGSMPSSKTPGDKDQDITEAKPDQSKISKPFSQAFPQETDPQPFLTSFASFSR